MIRPPHLVLFALTLAMVAACDDKEPDDTADTAVPAAADADGDGFNEDDDCDDGDAAIFPGAEELCDGVDNDCDGTVDEDDASDASTWYADTDGDGYGDGESSTQACEAPSGHLADATDCDDGDAAVFPGAEELCDGVDNDCDGTADEDDASDASTWYADTDGDGHGDASATTAACTQPTGFVSDASDCDDGDGAIHPAASEVCDEVDNDCDGTVDESDATDAATWYADADSDGYGDAGVSTHACDQPSGFVDDDADCDDGDRAIHPSAVELCDSVDNDCDGSTDEPDAADAGEWYADVDGDSYGDLGVTAVACTQPSGFVGDDTDCDDSDGTIHPAAIELCDSVDNDCDGRVDDDDGSVVGQSTWYADADGDGYGDGASSVEACSAPSGWTADSSDCEDSDSTVNPSATEICGDGLDNDCDGAALGCTITGDHSLADAEASFLAETSYNFAGRSVAGAGDVDGDGYNDLLIGAYGDAGGGSYAGATYLIQGPVTGDMSLADADAKIIGEAERGYSGTSSSSAGDVDGDGFDDLLLSAYALNEVADDAGAAYLVLGPVSGDMSLTSADARFLGEGESHYAGFGIASAGDVDADGFDDLLIGAMGYDGVAYSAGIAYLVYGPVSGDLDLASADARMLGEAEADCAGASVAGAGDVDGDGFADMLIGAPYASEGGPSAGMAYLVHGPVSGDLDLASADARLIGEEDYDNACFGIAGPGDVNGDGHDDLLLGAYNNDRTDTAAGVAYLVLGPVSGDLDLGSADAILTGEALNDHAGKALSGAGDVDGDGNDDLLIGAVYNDAGGTDTGTGYLVLGPVSGEHSLADADARILGQLASEWSTYSLAAVGDVDGDGWGELLIGAPGNTTVGSYGGAAYLFSPTDL